MTPKNSSLAETLPSYCNFPESRKKFYLKIISLFYMPTLNIICFVENEYFFFLRFCLCIFESDTVKSDCLVQIFRKILKYLIQTVGLPYCFFTVCSGDIYIYIYKKKALKMTS